MPGPPKTSRRSLLPLAAALGLAACGPGRPDGHDRDVVVVVLDALAAEELGCYGYERSTTPEIDAFSVDAVRFEDALAPATYTLASTASLFTGLGPAAHGVVGLRTNLLAGEHRTIAEEFRDAGWATAGFSCNHHITREGGFAQGFGTFEHYVRDRFDQHAVPEAVLGDVLAWWDAHEGERRFLYVHLLPPHQPYDAPPPHAARFGADRTERREGMTDFLVELDRSGVPLAASDALVERIRARYDAGVHYADAVFGELLAALDERGARDDATVVLLSDHGEAFAQHGRLLHGTTAFVEMSAVPLLVRWPGSEGGARSETVRTRDLAATLAELHGVGWPADGTRGASFAGRLVGGDGADGEVPVALTRSIGTQPVWAVRDGARTLIEHRQSGTAQLFDRDRDPAELRDVGRADGASLGRLSRALADRLQEDRRVSSELGARPGRATAWDEALEDLGYFEGEEPDAPADGGRRDARDQ